MTFSVTLWFTLIGLEVRQPFFIRAIPVFCCDAFGSEWGCDVEACVNGCNGPNGDRVLIEDRAVSASDDGACSAGGRRWDL